MALPHSTDIYRYPARFQFGEAGAPCSGSSCCTDTCIKMIEEYYKERTHSLAAIRRIAQARTSFNEAPCTGINHVEALNALHSLGLSHYKVGFGVSAAQVWNYVAIGPVLVGIYYGSYPNEHNHCGPIKAELSGRTDCGFGGTHAILAIGRRNHIVGGKVVHRDFDMRDPNHHSAARPETPAYDRITYGQLDKAMRDIVPKTIFTSTYIIYPTRKKNLASL